MPYLPCPSSCINSRGNILSHSTEHSLTLVILLAFYLPPYLLLSDATLHTSSVFQQTAVAGAALIAVANMKGKVGNLWKVHSTPLAYQAMETGSATAKRRQLASQTSRRIEASQFPPFDPLYLSYSGADPDFVGLKLRQLGSPPLWEVI